MAAGWWEAGTGSPAGPFRAPPPDLFGPNGPNPNAVEADLQRAREKNPWILGGRFVDLATRRLLAPGTEIDLPLLRPDGVLHAIEIKRANTKVVAHQRGRLIPSAEVHRAVEQVMDYFVSLDERREETRKTWRIDVRRCQATVVIGHPRRTEEDPRAFHGALRVYNSHLSRIEVITYQELIDTAEHAVDFTRSAPPLPDA
ncbi:MULTISPECIES: Shedu anti-phage system protein SduA domain-containing protein [Nocardiopsis]|uniref:Shedu anti-phage system protein SduA domain-containing protein n=1 Tax=Nocardiopsis TaxID=2013 RepID=UPI00147847B0|nr:MULTISPECIES: Shedu anti-phage system protein SduA domain-containing protein [Nocardiopsis]